MQKFDTNYINEMVDKLDFTILNSNDKELVNQLNQTIFIISNYLVNNEYNSKITNQLIKLIDKINKSLNNIEEINKYVLIFSVQNALKLLYQFNQSKALQIWNKYFINNLIEQNEPEMLFNEKKIYKN